MRMYVVYLRSISQNTTIETGFYCTLAWFENRMLCHSYCENVAHYRLLYSLGEQTALTS